MNNGDRVSPLKAFDRFGMYLLAFWVVFTLATLVLYDPNVPFMYVVGVNSVLGLLLHMFTKSVFTLLDVSERDSEHAKGGLVELLAGHAHLTNQYLEGASSKQELQRHNDDLIRFLNEYKSIGRD